MRVFSLLLRCMLHVLLIVDCFSKEATWQVYMHGGTQSGRIPVTEDPITSISVIDCGRRCSARTCQAFYFERSTRLCRLVVSVFSVNSSTSMTYQNAGGTLDFYYRSDTQSLLSSVYNCPSGSDEETTVVTPWLELTFWAYTETMSHTAAWQACMDRGLVLMKIDTVEKQAMVRHVLNTCPVLTTYEYWLDGYQNSTTGVWQFADGSLMPMDQIHFWMADKPNGSNGCVRTLTDHKWDDSGCGNPKSYICEA